MQQEKIGSFSYLSMYVPIRDDKGKAYGFLNIPYYSSEKDLNIEISNFLITIINLNAFIFLIAGLIAWLVTSRITKSFVIIGDKMKEVSLGKNEIIQWNKKDEIGDLVKEYNKMVLKLEESAAVLAKSEREGAWREMARQVAHEIKNPLTPMKLSIQYLQKAIDNGSENIKDLTTKVSQTLVEQIDHLSSIASDFSQFANIQNSKTEILHIMPVLQSLQLLFSNENNTDITIRNQAGDVCILADKTQINRLFTNLIKNALQAYAPEAGKKLDIELSSKESVVEIRFRDFGSGIPVHLQERIFTPNFTTKTSGTGLGLAISKGIAEQHGGSIRFLTEEHKGTTFIVSLPAI
jgi:nitrogen fixation/metabolism regulation signal transduction histidine kinase